MTKLVRTFSRNIRRTLAVALCGAVASLPMTVFASGNDFNGDGRADIFWRYGPAGYVAAWYMNGTSIGSSWFSSANISSALFTTLGANDFNKDGRGDILWRSSNGDMSLWFGANDGFTGGIIGATPAGWTLLGNGDINGDGAADLIWRNDATGQIAYWYMNGATAYDGALVTPNATGLRLVGVKDLNNDGRADMIWSNDVVRQVSAWISFPVRPIPDGRLPTDFNAAFVANYQSGSTPIALGDVNGDNRADIYWRYPGTGLFGYWAMSGTNVLSQNIVTSGLPSTYRYVNTGDYNGDGRDDILWANGVTDMHLWASTWSGYTMNRVGDIPGGWVPVL